VFEADPDAFAQVPGAPFAYWQSDQILRLFSIESSLESHGRTAKGGMKTQGDFRFLRLSWELGADKNARWAPLCKGGSHSAFYYGVAYSRTGPLVAARPEHITTIYRKVRHGAGSDAMKLTISPPA
jgi:hypothetical protein